MEAWIRAFVIILLFPTFSEAVVRHYTFKVRHYLHAYILLLGKAGESLIAIYVKGMGE